ncbi:hypothetical protein KC343_g568 [Hortaea werneckii]|nr:hypothetical protein KC352_g4365 [Hortaea werneckii]KAI7572508.1 hypothetical protein KC317_g706 [Hortaea werneckii]KAI7627628.1 hypothetical protein KC346_g653 [Hortaea werneckii]KAI7637687.1 hypothetical protein KC343_g568 [Hortaea werneckii]KAI7683135.1 hypothetical protein KC319_g615 [Hortaea werneckii]
MGEKTSLPSLLNFRDVGLATGNTAALPAGRLYRAYDIDGASEQDRRHLREALGITSLINLWGPPDTFVPRKDDTSQYQEQYPDKIRSFQVLDLNIHEISLRSPAYIANSWKSISWKVKARGFGWALAGQTNNVRKVLDSALQREVDWLKNAADVLAFSKLQIKAIFEALVQKGVRPVLIYGPNTTLTFCLLLGLLGVAEDKISHEYQLTEQNSEAILEYDNVRRKDFGLAAITSFDLPQSFVLDVLNYINSEYDGVDVYLSSIGLTHHQLESVKKNFQGTESSNEKLIDVEEQYIASSFA